eukprot:scaffold1509_cov240-Pinguiococcus_pyrenoidosus.AAC.23
MQEQLAVVQLNHLQFLLLVFLLQRRIPLDQMIHPRHGHLVVVVHFDVPQEVPDKNVEVFPRRLIRVCHLLHIQIALYDDRQQHVQQNEEADDDIRVRPDRKQLGHLLLVLQVRSPRHGEKIEARVQRVRKGAELLDVASKKEVAHECEGQLGHHEDDRPANEGLRRRRQRTRHDAQSRLEMQCLQQSHDHQKHRDAGDGHVPTPEAREPIRVLQVFEHVLELPIVVRKPVPADLRLAVDSIVDAVAQGRQVVVECRVQLQLDREDHVRKQHQIGDVEDVPDGDRVAVKNVQDAILVHFVEFEKPLDGDADHPDDLEDVAQVVDVAVKHLHAKCVDIRLVRGDLAVVLEGEDRLVEGEHLQLPVVGDVGEGDLRGLVKNEVTLFHVLLDVAGPVRVEVRVEEHVEPVVLVDAGAGLGVVEGIGKTGALLKRRSVLLVVQILVDGPIVVVDLVDVRRGHKDGVVAVGSSAGMVAPARHRIFGIKALLGNPIRPVPDAFQTFGPGAVHGGIRALCTRFDDGGHEDALQQQVVASDVSLQGLGGVWERMDRLGSVRKGDVEEMDQRTGRSGRHLGTACPIVVAALGVVAHGIADVVSFHVHVAPLMREPVRRRQKRVHARVANDVGRRGLAVAEVEAALFDVASLLAHVVDTEDFRSASRLRRRDASLHGKVL